MDIIDKVHKLNKEHGKKIERGTRAIEKSERRFMVKINADNKRLHKINRDFKKKHSRILR